MEYGDRVTLWVRNRCALASSPTRTRTSKRSSAVHRGVRPTKASTSTSASATRSATAPARTSAARSSASARPHTILGNHDAAVAGPDGLLVLLRRRAPRARPARAPADAREHGVAQGRCPTRCARATSTSATARRSTSRSSSTSSRPSRRRSASRSGTTSAPLTFIGHSHLCKSFALTQDGVTRSVAIEFELRPGLKYIISVGSVGQPRDYDTARQLHALRHRQEAVRVQARRLRHQGGGGEDFSADLERNFGHRLFIGV